MIRIIEDTAIKLSGLTSLFISFDYHPEIVNIIKNTDKYIYDKSTFTWETPITSLAYLVNNLVYIDNIDLTLKKDSEKIKHFYPKLNHKYPPYAHQLEGIQYGLVHDSWLLLDSPGMGKALTLDTNVLTPEGYKKIKDIHPGNIIFDKDGSPVKVLNEYNHNLLNMYEITFSSGYKIKCCEDHLWEIIYDRPKWDKKLKKHIKQTLTETHDTKWLLSNNRLGNSLYKSYFCRIPFCKPVKFASKEHYLDPYIVGYLIGDGCLHTELSFTTVDNFVADKIKKLLPQGYTIKNKKNSDLVYLIIKDDTNKQKFNEIYQEIKRLKLNTTAYFKHIPEEYLFDSVENRIKLLQGLMDSDGYISSRDKSSASSFGTSSENLSNDFEFLINSLGGYVSKKEYYPSYFNKKYNKLIVSKYKHYTLGIHLDNQEILCSLPRKKERLKNRHFHIRHKIKDIQFIGKFPGKCLTVDGPSHTYLIDKCIVTHNTLQMIYLAEELKEQKGLEHCLIICGINTLKQNWKAEIQKYSTLSCRILGEKISKKGKISYASIKERAEEIMKPLNDFFIIVNVESIRSEDFLQAVRTTKNKIGMIVLDEAHRCANSSSLQGKNLLKLKNYTHKIALTGTLIMNRPIDAYTALKWIGVEKSTLTNFKTQYCIYGGFGGHQIIGYKNLDILKEEIESCSLRRRKEDLKDFPAKTVISQIIEMEEDHRKFYENVKAGIKEECNKIDLNKNNVLALTTRLRQATSCPSMLTTNTVNASKIIRAVELTEDIVESGDKVVIMSVFKEPIRQLNKLLAKYNPVMLTGDISESDCTKNIELFQTNEKYKVCLATTSKAGTGINLNAASYLISIDTPFTSALQEQVEDRINRLNNTKPATIYRLICQNTIDELVESILQTKKAFSDFVVDDIIDDTTMKILVNYIQDL